MKLQLLAVIASITLAAVYAQDVPPVSIKNTVVKFGKDGKNLKTLNRKLKGLHHYYMLHRLSVQIEVPSRGSISKKKLVCLYKFGMIFFRRMFSTTYLKMR